MLVCPPTARTQRAQTRRIEGSGRAALCILNHADAAQAVYLDEQSGTDLLTGEACGGNVTMAPYGVRIVRLE